jgi:hypothetical protein
MGYPKNRVVAEALHKTLADARSGKFRRRLNVVVMYSGGLDSVALLANVLQETDHNVHVHHIKIINFEGRDIAEDDAVNSTLTYLREHYRDFVHTTSTSEFMLGKGGGSDLQLQMFTAGRLHSVLGGHVDIVLTGHQFPAFKTLSEGAVLFNAMFAERTRKPEWLRPLDRVKKIDVYESIPSELAELTWSCRKPVTEKTADGLVSIPCGKCHACKRWNTLPIKHRVTTLEA